MSRTPFSNVNNIRVHSMIPEDQKKYDYTKANVHEMYNNAAEQASFRKVCLSEFKKLWQQQCPYLIIIKPATDLCLKCQLHVSVLSKLGNVTEEEK